MLRMYLLNMFFMALYLGLFQQNMYAHCGLNFCPRPDAEVKFFRTSLALHQVEFSLENNGYYSEAIPRLEYLGLQQWVFGASIPVVRLHIMDENKIGTGNPLLSISREQHLSSQNIIVLGSQLELPFGDEEDGIGTDHWMLVPFINYLYQGHILESSIGLGFRSVIFAHEHESNMMAMPMETLSPLYVQPHEDHEFLYRLAMGKSLPALSLRPELQFNGQYAFGKLEGQGRMHQNLGLAVDYFSKNLSVTQSLEIALGKNTRFDWDLGVEIKFSK